MDEQALGKKPAGVGIANAPPHDKLNDLSLECIWGAEDITVTTSSNGSDSTAAGIPRSNSVSGFGNMHQQLRRAERLAAQNRPVEALDLLRPVLARRPQDADVLCLQAACLVATGNTVQALAAYAGALAANPNHVRALLGCAGLHKESGLLQEAQEFLERAHTIAAKATQPVQRESASEETESSQNEDGDGAGESDTSAPTTSSGVEESTESENQGDFEDADSQQLRDQISLALAMVLTDLGTQAKLANKHRWKDLYKRAVAVAPTYASAHYNLGVAAAEEGDEEEALERYQIAVKLEPRYAEAWCNLGVLHKSAGRLAQAISAYEKALIAGPNLDVIRLNLASALTEHGTALKAAGDRSGGVRAYERAVALMPRHVEALYNLGVAHTEAGELDKGVFM